MEGGRGEGTREKERKREEGMSGGREKTERYMKASLLMILDHRTMELVKVLATWYAAYSLNVVAEKLEQVIISFGELFLPLKG